jgi:hypothetical protein
MSGPESNLLAKQNYPIQIAWINDTMKEVALTLTEINIIFNNNPVVEAYFKQMYPTFI